MTRRLAFIALSLAALAAAGTASAQTCDQRFPLTCLFSPFLPQPQTAQPPQSDEPLDLAPPDSEPQEQEDQVPPRQQYEVGPAVKDRYAALYAPMDGGRFPVPAVRLADIDPRYLRQAVYFPTREAPGTIVIDPHNHFLYLVQDSGRAIRYGVGVGRQGFEWSGAAVIHDKQEWPDWYPPKEMIQRQPELARQMSELQSGIGMHGGPRNPLGARAIYLWQGNKDTLFLIHGTVEPWTIGKSVSSGCIRMINQDVIDLYQRTPVGSRVVVLAAR
jgi:lipoprotein-anchoring transpeptidase ErfK/SrfK